MLLAAHSARCGRRSSGARSAGLANTLGRALRRKLKLVIEKALTQTSTIEAIEVEDLTLGESAPAIRAVKIYDTTPDKARFAASSRTDGRCTCTQR